jgi:hypothetical protein
MPRWMRRGAAVASGSMVLLGFAVWAQEDDPGSSCVYACYEDEERCYQTCDEADDPAACEEQCQEAATLCLEECE